jgi:2-desacetyl-2-hydroxyethyl bacteriochlorophyllide A dehydrogenase
MQRNALYFKVGHRVEVISEPLPAPGKGELLVRTIHSAISAGSEMLLFTGKMPFGAELDLEIGPLQGQVSYPTKYGYASVGEVVGVGDEVSESMVGSLVFSFQPHQSHFVTPAKDAMQVPNDIELEDAVLLASVETALSLVMDGSPMVGEKVVVIGQGVIGLLITGILSMMPLARLVTIENLDRRKELSVMMGSHACFTSQSSIDALREDSDLEDGSDLTFEVSGNPEALRTALSITGYDGRILVGSWYGDKRASLDLGTRFHRNRNRILSSQVSRLDPRLSGRWTKSRRIAVAWDMMRRLRPSRLITHRFPLQEAQEAYELLENHPEDACQVIFTYGGD